MRHMPIVIAAVCLLVTGLAVPLNAEPSEDRGPCGQITAACRGAGFRLGGAGTGTGLLADCIVPIMQGTPQPRRARNSLPHVDPQLVADCKASNPRFGQMNTPPSELASPAREAPQPTIAPHSQAFSAGIGQPCASRRQTERIGRRACVRARQGYRPAGPISASLE